MIHSGRPGRSPRWSARTGRCQEARVSEDPLDEVGCSLAHAPPGARLATDEGWRALYHGVRNTPAGCPSRLGLALLDCENPEKVLRRTLGWVMGEERHTGPPFPGGVDSIRGLPQEVDR